MKVLSDGNRIIRKMNTHRTQCVHRMRIRLLNPEYLIDDLDVKTNCLYPDTERVENSDIFDNNNLEQTREFDGNKTTNTWEKIHSCILKDSSAAVT